MNKPTNLADRYKAFFVNEEAGQFFMETARAVVEGNLNVAMQENSLDYLSRAKGGQEILGIINTVIKTEEAKKPK